ncbi:hypothetical protein Ccrd_013816 [Cynara cardunculus var. scolymus]|uniref:Cleavage stimulation factor subunit 2 hinge domain-containing protein n=1 Tax=Cynara cardunculus var. scolymus TaxID=59895 RepID=A0A103YEW3_CYNCS|nr:hypothetical protein Ccrd_013816 [Cynara cardunculus var. scolymus]
MAGNQVTGDGLSMNLAGMSKNQLYDIMSQMKTLIEQNQDQARQILIQNPLLTKALFQAQIMLGMLQPPQEIPNIQPAGSQHPQQATPPAQQPNAQATPLPGQSNLRDPTSAPTQQNQANKPMPSSSVSPSNPSLPSHPLQSTQLSRSHLNAQTAPIPSPQSSQLSNMAALPPHYSSQAPSALQPTMPAVTTPLQQPLHISNMPHLPLQPPLPSQPRPPSMPAFPHQNYSHMGPNAGFQHPVAPQLHHSQPMFHSGSRPPTSMGPPFSQGQPLLPNQQPSQALYQHKEWIQYKRHATIFATTIHRENHLPYSMFLTYGGRNSPTAFVPSRRGADNTFGTISSRYEATMGSHTSRGIGGEEMMTGVGANEGGGSHVGMDFNQMGIPSLPERGSNWMPSGLSENAAAGAQLPGPSPPFLPSHMGSGSQPPRPASLTADMEKALLQQVMSLTPEQINLLPPEQRNQVHCHTVLELAKPSQYDGAVRSGSMGANRLIVFKDSFLFAFLLNFGH